MKRKDRTAEKRQPIPKRFSGDGSAPPRLSVWFSALFLLPFRGVCLAAARDGAAHLSMPSTRHGAIFVFPSISSLKIPLFDDIRVSTIRSRIGFIKCCQGRQVDGGSKNKSMSSSKVCYSINYSLINVRNHS